MRLMTYNILFGGRDGANDARLGKVCALIHGLQPDLLVLNECNDFERDGFRNFHRVERELGMRGLLAPARTGFHVAMFVRQPGPAELLETRPLDHGLHHAALVALLEIAGERWVVIGAHLCPFGGEVRLSEVQQLMRFLREDHLVLLGDLNALSPADAAQQRTDHWLPRRRTRHQLAGSGGQLDTRAIAALEECGLVDTFRAAGAASPTVLTRLHPEWQSYQVRIDYVFATADAAQRVVRTQRIEGELADEASDHYPLVVDLMP